VSDLTSDAPSVAPVATTVASNPDDDNPSEHDDPLPPIDLDAMAAELDGVDAALVRLADGTYWTDEVTGEPIPPAVLEADPTARRS
jgi:RNA polymerase-binding transcription factor DksA